MKVAEIYTDGSCHTQYRTGVWVAILLIGAGKTIISGKVPETTHNKMELSAVIKGFEYIKIHHRFVRTIKIYSDSQYVIGLCDRKEKLTVLNFSSRQGKELQNASLIQDLLEHISSYTTEFVKVKAHQKNTGTLNYNAEADKLSRKMVREMSLQYSDHLSMDDRASGHFPAGNSYPF